VATFVLTWDGGDLGYPPGDYEADVATTASGLRAECRWSFGTRRNGTIAGDRVFLLRQGASRGIVAAGSLLDGLVTEEPHWEDPSRTAHYVRVLWDRVLPVVDRIPTEELLVSVPGHHWNAVLASGQILLPPSDEQLERLWAAHLTSRDEAVGWDLEPGDVLGRRDRMARFGGAMYGGIQPSKTSPNVFIYSDPHAGTNYGYDYDGWTTDGTAFLYTGEGRRGHQRLRAGNAAIFNHASDGRTLRLFVADGTEPGSDARIQRYLGEFTLDREAPYVTAEAPDEDGNARTVLVFRLLPVGSVLRRAEDASATGGAPTEATARAVPVAEAQTPPGSAEAVPIEALGVSSFPVRGSTSTVAVKLEAELVARYQAHLEAGGSSCCRYRLRPAGELRDLYTDILDTTKNVLYEAKGVSSREAVRMALGQLLDYSRHIPTQPSLAVLLPAPPAADLLDLLARHEVTCVYETSPGVFAES
jgi:hypothetical protein